MTLLGKNKVDTNRYELEISVDADAFEEAVAKAYKREVEKITVPGFRKGKAPRAIIEKMYDSAVALPVDKSFNDYTDADVEANGPFVGLGLCRTSVQMVTPVTLQTVVWL